LGIYIAFREINFSLPETPLSTTPPTDSKIRMKPSGEAYETTRNLREAGHQLILIKNQVHRRKG
ncbi:hypothetical protein, partial [Rhizobium sp.]|uniref:hypothetical protein n=1 Tax=Rhizobium sp. TaxID=391 RepID=UPI00389A5719